MIRVTVGSAGGVHRLVVEGHAGYNPGNDIVCAGVSAIVHTLAEWMKRHEPSAWVRQESGRAVVTARCESEASCAVFEAAVEGLREMGVRYGEWVTVDIFSKISS